MSPEYEIDAELIGSENAHRAANLERDYGELGDRLARRGIDIESITKQLKAFQVAIPSWGVGTGGTRFARFPGPGEPRNIYEKIEDCSVIRQLVCSTSTVSTHFPWDSVEDYAGLAKFAQIKGLAFDAVNSNTFQDQQDQSHSYKFGSLSHIAKPVRDQAIAHNIECIEAGQKLGSHALTIWVADGSNFPGQQNFRDAFDRYLDSMTQIYARLPHDWQLFIEHKLFEPAFYATVIADWGSSYLAATQLGDKAKCLVDLGHHAPNTNIELIVARLAHFGKLGGFHFNDSKYGDDDLDSGSINPYQLFLVFNELADATERAEHGFAPAYMMDQSHNVTDPIESLITSAVTLQRTMVQAALVDRSALGDAQADNDAILASQILQQAYTTDVAPITAKLRFDQGGAIDPLKLFRRSDYRKQKTADRPESGGKTAGIV